MPGIENNLYPAVVSTYMPAFVRTSACRVYFSLSIYNNVDEIKNVQVIINNQNTNLSALDPKLYPAGIKITELQVDYGAIGDDKYFISIAPEDLKTKEFELNQFYKVQFRFTGKGAENLTDQTKIASWLVNNQRYFSEWSRVSLIKGIEKPKIYLRGFEDINDENTLTVFTSEMIEFVGKMSFEKNENIEKEYLKSYSIKIYKLPEESTVYDSGEIFTNIYNPNEINYTLKAALEDGANYRIRLKYKTVNEYENSVSYLFTIIQNTIDALNATIKAKIEKDFGRAKIDINATISEIFFGNLTIRRTSSRSNFTIWEDIHQVVIANGEILNYTWYDYTIESGVWYKYCAQRRNSKGDRGAIINIRYPIMDIFDDMFLAREGMQIRLKYDPGVSSFRRNLLESKTDTLGSKYPFIRRNGNVNYRQFPITGLITSFCDEEGIFLNKGNIYGESMIHYQDYNEENNITEYQDYIYEREFREKVMDFLYANTVKLFKSTTEGNIVVRLMDINFTPNQTLGRMIYSFSANAYEIDENTLESYDKYGIQKIGDYSRILKSDFSYVGQLQGIYKADKEIMSILQEKYSNKSTNKYINTVSYLKWIRVIFDMPPYLIKTTADGNIEPLPAGETGTEDTALGYILYINKKPIIVTTKNYYELIDVDTVVTSLYFPVDSNVTIDYEVVIDQTENKNLLFSKMFFFTKVGQIIDTFDINENIFLRLYNKYYEDYKSYKKQLLTINEITVEAEPGAILYVKDSYDDNYFEHEIGPTGVLNLHNKDVTLNGFYFIGIRLYPSNPETDEIRKNEFREIKEESFNAFEEIDKPEKNCVYIVNNKQYIYYNQKWFEFSNNIVQCPVHALIDYIYDSMKGEY